MSKLRTLAIAPLLLVACAPTPLRYEQGQSSIRLEPGTPPIAFARVALDPIVPREAGPTGGKATLRLYLENSTTKSIRLRPNDLRLLDGRRRDLIRAEFQPRAGLDIAPGRTARFDATFQYPPGGRPDYGSTKDFVLLYKIDHSRGVSEGRVVIAEDLHDEHADP